MTRCFFCRQDHCDAFDLEFDTPVHLDCIREYLIKDSTKKPDERSEAQFMVYLLEFKEQEAYREQERLRQAEDDYFWEHEYVPPTYDPIEDDGSGELF